MSAESLRRRAAWAGVRLITYRAIGFGWSLIALSYLLRLVGTESFGAYAAAAAVLNFFSNLGVSGRLYLVRQPEGVERRLFDLTFWGLLGLSFGVGVGLLFIGLAAARSNYHGVQFAEALTALAMILPVMVARCVPTALLERDLDYGRLARVEVGRHLVFGVVGVGCAWQGGSAWALVIAHWSSEIVQTVALFCSARYRPRWSWNFEGVRRAVQESFAMSAGAWLYELRCLGPTLILLPLAGERAVGYYAFAERLLCGLSIGSGAIAQLAVPIYAKLQNDQPALLQAIYSSAQAQLLVFGSLALGMALVAPAVLPQVLGEQSYHPVMTLTVSILCTHTLLGSISGAQAQALYVRRRIGFMLLLNMFFVLVLIPMTALGVWLMPAPYKAAGYALGYLAAHLPVRWQLHCATRRWIGEPIYGMNLLWTVGLGAALFAPFTGYWSLLGLLVFLHPASLRATQELIGLLKEASWVKSRTQS